MGGHRRRFGTVENVAGPNHEDPQRSQTDRIVLLETHDPDRARVERTAIATPWRRLRWLTAGLAALLLSVGLAATVWSSLRDGEPPAEEGATPAGAPPAADAPPRLTDAEAGEIQRDNRYSEVDAMLDDIVVGAVFGDGADQRLLYGSPQALDYVPYDRRDFDRVDLDSSGTYLAATYRNAFAQNVLVVGRLQDDGDWVVEPAAVDINGFAWHPHRGGQLGFATANLTGGTQVSVVDLTRSRPFTWFYRADFPGRLRSWGDWGFAFDEPGPAPRTSVARYPDEVSPTANNLLVTLTTGTPGRALGLIGPERLLIDGADVPIVLNLQNAVYESNPWFGEEDEVVRLRTAPSGRFSVALLAPRDAPNHRGGQVVLFTADAEAASQPAVLLFEVTGPTAFDWSTSGRFVAGYQPAVIGQEGDRVSPASITVYDLDRALFVGREIRMADGVNQADLRIDVQTLAFREERLN